MTNQVLIVADNMKLYNIPNKHFIISRRIAFLTILLTTAALCYLCAMFPWSSDCSFYALKWNFDGSQSYDPLQSLQDVFTSVAAHWMVWNGRAFCNVFVMIFCGLLPKWMFVVCNGLVWLAFLSLVSRLCGFSLSDSRPTSVLCLVCFFIFVSLPLDPAFLVNYLWMGCITVGWLLLFFGINRFRSPWMIAAAFIFSLLAGNSQESFSIPLGLGLLVWLVRNRRGRASAPEWIMGIGFAMGAVFNILSPGNFVRLSSTMEDSLGLLDVFITNLPVFGSLLALTFLYLLMNPRRIIAEVRRNDRRFFTIALWSVLGGFLLCLALKGANMCRILIPVCIWLLALFLRADVRMRRIWVAIAAFWLAFVATTLYEARLFAANQNKINEIKELYHLSQNGKISLPDSLFSHDMGFNCYYFKGWEIDERRVDRSKPDLKIYPASLARITLRRDTNFMIPIGDQRWIVARSLSNPRFPEIRFVFLPGIADVRLKEKELDIAGMKHAIVDTVGGTVYGVYGNRFPKALIGVSESVE